MRGVWCVLLPMLAMAATDAGAQTRFITVADSADALGAELSPPANDRAEVRFAVGRTSVRVAGGDYLAALGAGDLPQGEHISAVRTGSRMRRAADVGSDPGHLPEPATWAMLMTGFGLVAAAIRRGIRISERRFTARIRRIEAGEAR